MTSDATDNTMGAEFEAYYSGVHQGMSLEQSFGGFYTEWQVQVCWQAWQAARADTARHVAEAVAAEREACAVTAWSSGMGSHNAAMGLPVDARETGARCAAAIRARTASQYSKPDREPSEDEPISSTNESQP